MLISILAYHGLTAYAKDTTDSLRIISHLGSWRIYLIFYNILKNGENVKFTNIPLSTLCHQWITCDLKQIVELLLRSTMRVERANFNFSNFATLEMILMWLSRQSVERTIRMQTHMFWMSSMLNHETERISTHILYNKIRMLHMQERWRAEVHLPVCLWVYSYKHTIRFEKTCVGNYCCKWKICHDIFDTKI